MEYPRTLMELEERFSDEEACRQYLVSLRWPEGFVCPRCKGRQAWTMQAGRLLCGSCRYQISVTAGTIFQGTHLPMTTWFRAMWHVTSQKNGMSALGLQRVLGLGSYKTAWAMLHKFRRAMVRPGRDRLTGQVEVDETHQGAIEHKHLDDYLDEFTFRFNRRLRGDFCWETVSYFGPLYFRCKTRYWVCG